MNLNTQKKIETDNDFVLAGSLGKPVGKNGELKLIHSVLSLENVNKIKYFFVKHYLKLELDYAEQTNKGIIIKFKYYTNQHQAELLSSQEVYIAVKDYKTIDEESYNNNIIIGADVFYKDKKIGIVKHIIYTGANDVIEIDTGDEEILLPVIDEVVKEINYEKKIVIVDEIEEYI